MQSGSTIVGMGRYVPVRVVTNAELAPTVDSTDEWIRSHTGIQERRIAAPEEATSDLAFGAANSGFGAELAVRFRHVEEIARLPRRTEGMNLEAYGLYRVSDPTGRVLEKD